FIDKQGRLIIPFQFSDGTDFVSGLAGVLKNNMCGYIDPKGKLVIPLKYDEVNTFRFGWGNVKREGAWTFVDVHGKELGQWFGDSKSFSEGLAVVAPVPAEEGGVKEALRYGFLDTAGKMAIAPLYEDARPFSTGYAAVRVNKKWGYINKTGKMVIQPQFDAAGPFSEGLAQIQIGTKMGYIDETGTMVIEPRFELDTQQEDPDEEIEMTGKFVDGLACVRFAVGPESNGGWGFIDKTGKFAIPPRYENADMFAEGLASVQYKGKWGFVDPKGNLVIPAKYDSVKRFSEGLAMVEGGR
ncbi:MAG TPA: WG repeat-containing protein, partial [Acidobacteriota bacterium]|nr:WG repeat-containing protein [Acidobacteriota bacterium]